MTLQPFVAEVDLAQLSSRVVRLQPQAGEHPDGIPVFA
jgi:hypothetical protein